MSALFRTDEAPGDADPRDDIELCSVSLLELAREPGPGGQLGVAAVELLIAGVPIEIRGIRITRVSSTRVEVRSPAHRRTGEWCGSIVLPPEIATAVTQVVLDAWRGWRTSEAKKIVCSGSWLRSR